MNIVEIISSTRHTLFGINGKKMCSWFVKNRNNVLIIKVILTLGFQFPGRLRCPHTLTLCWHQMCVSYKDLVFLPVHFIVCTCHCHCCPISNKWWCFPCHSSRCPLEEIFQFSNWPFTNPVVLYKSLFLYPPFVFLLLMLVDLYNTYLLVDN